MEKSLIFWTKSADSETLIDKKSKNFKIQTPQSKMLSIIKFLISREEFCNSKELFTN